MPTLQKAKLICVDGSDDIEFMFNPKELKFSRSMSLEQAEGAHTDEGDNKTSFKHPNPYSLSISNIMLDTYEAGTSVLTHISKFTQAVEFSEKGEGKSKRPPIYIFTWGNQKYLRCFVEKLDFDLTLFLPDGTPVRAVVNLSLKQVDSPTARPSQGSPNPSQGARASSGRGTFL